MMFWESLMGRLKCKIVSASLSATVNKISDQCEMFDLKIIDPLTATFWVRRTDYSVIRKYDGIILLDRYGLFWTIKRILMRPVLTFGLLIFLLLTFYLPTRVLFINVNGNKTLSDAQILDAAQNCGISFGAPRNKVRSEKVKNALLQSLPQLQWACINTRGCVAEISVHERYTKENQSISKMQNVVAVRDGIITSMTVYRGTPLCAIGQAVKKNQMLVSGYSNLGLLIKQEAANAEIRGETQRSVTAVTLAGYTLKQQCVRTERTYAIQMGKKLIKFQKGSGISPPECGRINKIYDLTLPGGYRLPFAVVVEHTLYYDSVNQSPEDNAEFNWFLENADAAVYDQMIAGKVLKREASMSCDNNICMLYAVYRCDELIGTIQSKEIYTDDGKRD